MVAADMELGTQRRALVERWKEPSQGINNVALFLSASSDLICEFESYHIDKTQ